MQRAEESLYEPTRIEMGHRIRDVIAATRLTHRGFAELMSTTSSQVTRWKNGDSITPGLPMRIANKVSGKGWLTIPPAQIRDFIQCQADDLPLRFKQSGQISYAAQIAA
jgi:hypothetical protein